MTDNLCGLSVKDGGLTANELRELLSTHVPSIKLISNDGTLRSKNEICNDFNQRVLDSMELVAGVHERARKDIEQVYNTKYDGRQLLVLVHSLMNNCYTTLLATLVSADKIWVLLRNPNITENLGRIVITGKIGKKYKLVMDPQQKKTDDQLIANKLNNGFKPNKELKQVVTTIMDGH